MCKCFACKKNVPATNILHVRDYEEGLNGPIYEYCRECFFKAVKRNELLGAVPKSKIPK